MSGNGQVVTLEGKITAEQGNLEILKSWWGVAKNVNNIVLKALAVIGYILASICSLGLLPAWDLSRDAITRDQAIDSLRGREEITKQQVAELKIEVENTDETTEVRVDNSKKRVEV